MSLGPLLVVEQNHDGGDEVNNLPGWKEVDVRPAVSATVTVPEPKVKDAPGLLLRLHLDFY